MLMWANVDVSPGVSRSDQGSLSLVGQAGSLESLWWEGLTWQPASRGQAGVFNWLQQVPQQLTAGHLQVRVHLDSCSFRHVYKSRVRLQQRFMTRNCRVWVMFVLQRRLMWKPLLKWKHSSGDWRSCFRSATAVKFTETEEHKRVKDSGEKSCKKCLPVTPVTWFLSIKVSSSSHQLPSPLSDQSCWNFTTHTYTYLHSHTLQKGESVWAYASLKALTQGSDFGLFS